MSENPWDALTSAFGSELDTIRKSITDELNSLGLGELADFVPHLFQLIRSMGGGDPLSMIRETAHLIAFGGGQALVAQALENFLRPLTDPVQNWQTHKQNLSEALQTHWSTMDGRISQLYTTDQFRGPAANALVDQHGQMKQNGKDLHNQLLDSNQADTQMLGSVHQAVQEKSSEIANLGPIGPLTVLIALQLAPPPTPPSTQSPPQWIQELEKDVEQWFQDPNPFDGGKPLIVRILYGIADFIAAVDLVTVAVVVSALALIIFSIYLLWLNQQPTPRQPRNLNGPQPRPVPTPLAPVNSADAADITKRLNDQGYNITQQQVEELLREGYTEKDIERLLSLLASIYGKGNVGKYIDQFASYGKDGLTIASIMSRLKAAYGLVVDPDTVDKLLTTDMGGDTYLTEDEAFQILKDFSSIYRYESDPTKGSQEVTKAVETLLEQGFDKETTLKLADAFPKYWQLMQQKTIVNKYGQRSSNPDYKATWEERLQAINNAVDGLNYNNLNPRSYRYFNSPNHAQHAREMGLTEEEYQQDAIDFLKGKPSNDELQLTRPNGEIIRWNKDTGDFGILQPNGNVKTYYDIGTGNDAWEYFLRQANSTGE